MTSPSRVLRLSPRHVPTVPSSVVTTTMPMSTSTPSSSLVLASPVVLPAAATAASSSSQSTHVLPVPAEDVAPPNDSHEDNNEEDADVEGCVTRRGDHEEAEEQQGSGSDQDDSDDGDGGAGEHDSQDSQDDDNDNDNNVDVDDSDSDFREEPRDHKRASKRRAVEPVAFRSTDDDHASTPLKPEVLPVAASSTDRQESQASNSPIAKDESGDCEWTVESTALLAKATNDFMIQEGMPGVPPVTWAPLKTIMDLDKKYTYEKIAQKVRNMRSQKLSVFKEESKSEQEPDISRKGKSRQLNKISKADFEMILERGSLLEHENFAAWAKLGNVCKPVRFAISCFMVVHRQHPGTLWRTRGAVSSANGSHGDSANLHSTSLKRHRARETYGARPFAHSARSKMRHVPLINMVSPRSSRSLPGTPHGTPKRLSAIAAETAILAASIRDRHSHASHTTHATSSHATDRADHASRAIAYMSQHSDHSSLSHHRNYDANSSSRRALLHPSSTMSTRPQSQQQEQQHHIQMSRDEPKDMPLNLTTARMSRGANQYMPVLSPEGRAVYNAATLPPPPSSSRQPVSASSTHGSTGASAASNGMSQIPVSVASAAEQRASFDLSEYTSIRSGDVTLIVIKPSWAAYLTAVNLMQLQRLNDIDQSVDDVFRAASDFLPKVIGWDLQMPLHERTYCKHYLNSIYTNLAGAMKRMGKVAEIRFTAWLKKQRDRVQEAFTATPVPETNLLSFDVSQLPMGDASSMCGNTIAAGTATTFASTGDSTAAIDVDDSHMCDTVGPAAAAVIASAGAAAGGVDDTAAIAAAVSLFASMGESASGSRHLG